MMKRKKKLETDAMNYSNEFCHPAHDDEQQQHAAALLLQQQQQYSNTQEQQQQQQQQHSVYMYQVYKIDLDCPDDISIIVHIFTLVTYMAPTKEVKLAH